jgi:DNA-binding response OmpR family regulator
MPTVLLVQSDPEVREVSAEWLRQAGFFVLECATGEEAVSLARVYVRRIDAVICDLLLLRMNGLRLVTELRKKDLQMRAIILSGGDRPADCVEQNVTLLQQPIDYEILVKLVRQLVDGQGA